jgi:hypothetical protein
MKLNVIAIKYYLNQNQLFQKLNFIASGQQVAVQTGSVIWST